MRFSVEHRFAAPVEAVERSMTDPDFFAELRGLPGIEAPVLLERRERPGAVELDVRYVFSGDLPSVARRVLGRGELAWVQRSTVDLEPACRTFAGALEGGPAVVHMATPFGAVASLGEGAQGGLDGLEPG